MKKIISLVALMALAVNCFGTGAISVNTPQTGSLSFTTNGSAFTSSTNLFSPGFTYPPAMSFFLVSGPTNALPMTSTVTATNFILSINTSTNATVFWSAIPASALIQAGSQPFSTSTTNVTFPTAYAYAPTVILTGNVLGSATNAYPVVTAVTTTNFTLSAGIAQTIYWQSFGEAATAGTQTVTH